MYIYIYTRLGRTADAVKDNGDAANDDEAEGLQDLSTVVSTIKQAVPFAVGGLIELCESDRGASLVILAAGNKQGVAGVLDRVDAAALLPHCTKATFGYSAQRMNRQDPIIRVACELAAGAWKLSALGAEPRFLSVIPDRVQAAVLDERQVVELVPQKVNVYEAGGFFAEHVDTPTDAQHMVGTVLVSLPISHAGGALVVKHNNTTQCFNFADHSYSAVHCVLLRLRA